MSWEDHISCEHDPKVIKKNKLTKYIDSQKEKLTELRKKRDNKLNKLIKPDIIDELNKRVEDLKPFTKERSNIVKTLSKKPMCEKRYYRFLKEPKGVMPTILQTLLDARKNTRKTIKENNKKIENTEDEKEIDNIKRLNNVLDKRQLAYKVSANSMYGAMGVKKGYLPFMPGAMCLDGESQISFSYGFTRKLKDLVNTNNLWSYKDGQIVSNGNGIKYNGKKEVVKITFIDGRTLRCTTDHKIMTTNGWIEAGKLLPKYNWDGSTFTTNTEYSKVITGLELPEDIIGEDEKKWKLLDFKMNTLIDREKTLAFCRILGFILADGSISKYIGYNNNVLFSSIAVLGTLFDAKLFVNDIKMITGQEPKIADREEPDEVKGSGFYVHIPKILLDKILMLEDIPIGKRTHQPYTLPKFLFENSCPLSIIREFLGGLFGGDGTSPSLSVSHPSFSPIQFGLTTVEKYKNDMLNTMNRLVNLLEKFGMKFWCANPRLAREREYLIPKDIKENPRWEYMITTNSCFNLLFAQKIGFRYCLDKNNKLTVAASYQRYSDSVRKQHINIVLTASNMYDLNETKITIKDILSKARKKVYENEFPLHEFSSLAKYTDILNHRSRPSSLENYKLLQKFFPTAREYCELTGCDHWFSKEQSSKKVYSIGRNDKVVPCFYLDVVDIKNDGIDDVFDIIDVPNNSFFSNGIVVHNCTTYMGRVNIELVAKTIPE
jgi:intein/homing endonuclease